MENIISMICSGAMEAATGNIVNQAYSSIVNKHEMQEGLDVTLFGLKNKVKELQSVIAEARERRIVNPKLAEWLSIIINATYVGDYFYRTFKNRNSLNSMIASEGTSDWSISSFFRAAKRRQIVKTSPFRDEELRELSNILKMLNMISVTTFLGILYAQPKIDRPLWTYSFMDNNRMVGREKEKEELIKLLLEPKVASEENVDILPIVGRKGVGKSTLAIHCRDDPMVKIHFSQIIYISSFFPGSVYEICRNILKEYSSDNLTHHEDDNTVVVMLKQNLSSERFLLIIDRVDHASLSVVWGVLWDCLRCGKEGSKVVLVTNFHSYCSLKERINIGRVKPIMLDFFPEDKYWLLFKEHAFGTADPKDYPELAMIGDKIAKRLGGSFWGAKSLGACLRDNLTTRFWTKVLDLILGSQNCGLHLIAETWIRLLPDVELDIMWENTKLIPSDERKYPDLKEAIAVGLNHYKLIDYTVHLWLTTNYFLSERIAFTAIYKPSSDKSKIFLGED